MSDFLFLKKTKEKRKKKVILWWNFFEYFYKIEREVKLLME